jgi:hypothetical protein
VRKDAVRETSMSAWIPALDAGMTQYQLLPQLIIVSSDTFSTEL